MPLPRGGCPSVFGSVEDAMLPPKVRWSGPGLLGVWVMVLPALAVPTAVAELEQLGEDRVQIPGMVRDLTPRFANADRHTAEGRWQEAVDAYLEIVRD